MRPPRPQDRIAAIASLPLTPGGVLQLANNTTPPVPYGAEGIMQALNAWSEDSTRRWAVPPVGRLDMVRSRCGKAAWRVGRNTHSPRYRDRSRTAAPSLHASATVWAFHTGERAGHREVTPTVS